MPTNVSTRTEINFNRLLHKCEAIAADKKAWDWRLEKYVEALQEQLNNLRHSPSKPSQETINEYSRRVDFLKGLLKAEQMPTVSERVLAAERLAPVSQIGSATSSTTKEAHLQTKSRHLRDMREELLGDPSSSAGLRQRKPQEEDDTDTILEHHHKMHARLADELLLHTRNLKEFATASNVLVKQDIQKVHESTSLASRNYTALQKESQRLEAKTKSSSWWIWMMLMVVTLTFLWMIVLMRIFPKK
ncbi:hypothetical protein CHS0354_018946 [Potamilus streckersoni]|uniref:Vesicle transport protein USE1 n=1 Tax=Potamilus streckersoni TaxID=2493646 RepID=A0AAE0W916_9BIVA|nr:hypothetical protein CHS0354_018946 [Potamilus streckersoni]